MKVKNDMLLCPELKKLTMLLTILIALLAFLPTVELQTLCGPVEEGNTFTVTCELDTTSCPETNALRWTTNRVSGTIATCGVNGCDSDYISQNYFAVTYTKTSSTLTIFNVSRTIPFNMDGSYWYCYPCSGSRVEACRYLYTYIKPENLSCTLSESSTTVTVTCTAEKVYPRGQCAFFVGNNGTNYTRINKYISQSSYLVSLTPTHYMMRCYVSITMEEMGEGTHSFRVIAYPDRDGGENLVDGPTLLDNNVTLGFPTVSHTCTLNLVHGYFPGKSTGCSCSLTSGSKPSANARWYSNGFDLGSSYLTVTYNSNDPEAAYTCEAVSNLGRKVGSTLQPKFAFLSLAQNPSKSTFDSRDRLLLNCSVQGNLEPTLLTLTRKRTQEILTSVQAASEVTHTFDSLNCIDTDVYVCSAPNSPAPSEETRIRVQCPQQLSPLNNSTNVLRSAMGETAFISINVYGFPRPSLLSLKKFNDSSELTLSTRHEVKYTAATEPFGFVSVSISDVEGSDFTEYSLTVDNGMSNALKYKFSLSLKQEDTGSSKQSPVGDDDALLIACVVISGIAILILVVLLVLIAFLVRTARMKLKGDSPYKVEDEPSEQTNGYELASSTFSKERNYPKKTPDLRLPTKPQNYRDMKGKLATSTNTANAEIYEQDVCADGLTSASEHFYHSTPPEDEKPQEIYNNMVPEDSIYQNWQSTGGVYNNTC